MSELDVDIRDELTEDYVKEIEKRIEELRKKKQDKIDATVADNPKVHRLARNHFSTERDDFVPRHYCPEPPTAGLTPRQNKKLLELEQESKAES